MAVDINVNGSLSFFEVCKELENVSLLVIGSTTEYKIKKANYSGYKENDFLKANSIYAATKIAAESIGLAYVNNYKANIKFTRSSNHTGPGQNTNYVLSNFAKQCADIRRKKQLPYISVGNIDIYRDFLDVNDIVRAYFLIMKKGKIGSVYNVSSKSTYLIKDLLDQLISLTLRDDIIIEVDEKKVRINEPKTLHYDSSLLSFDTGWQPKIQINYTLKKLFNYWYRK